MQKIFLWFKLSVKYLVIFRGIAFGGMIISSLIVVSGSEFVNIIPILSVYAFAGYRLIPALQQIWSLDTT